MRKARIIGKIVIATRNPAKALWYGEILQDIAKKILSLNDFDFEDNPEEKGQTAEENAMIKAIFYAQKTQLPVLAEDEALFVDFLPENQQPGVYVRRVGGKELDDDQLLAYWESLITRAPRSERRGKWHVAHCYATPDGKTSLTTLDYPTIFFSPSSKVRIPGWPMNSLSGPVEFRKPESELTEEEKKKHRLRAERLLKSKLKELFLGVVKAG